MAILVFDFDGTLHDSMKIFGLTFKYAIDDISRMGIEASTGYSDEQVSSLLGWHASDIADRVFPNEDESIKELFINLVGKYMYEMIDKGVAELYPGCVEMLKQLKDAGHTLLVLSNCRVEYFNTLSSIFGLDRYITQAYCAESYDFIPKEEIFEFVNSDYGSMGEEFIAIGDRIHDMTLAKRKGLKFIGCLYGFSLPGELDDADVLVNAVDEIPDVVSALISSDCLQRK